MFAFDGLRRVGVSTGGFGIAPFRLGRLAAGSVLLLANGADYAPLQGAPGESSGIFRRRRVVQLQDAVDVAGIPEAVALQQDAVVVLTDADDRVPRGTRVVIPSGTLASVVSAAEGSTGVVAPVPAAAAGGSGPSAPPPGAWWMADGAEGGMAPWLKWGMVLAGVGLVGYVGWQVWKEQG